ncbi:exosortase-dependent surface protein XDP2 [Leptodesmis sp.]|uniref:exosortase-dependent surface protein XDP2 n=1 Tax=Leptodesmis sp. TaxID=3100501 RepID=UPI0040535953
MNLKYVVSTISLLATGMMASGSPAQAFSFSSTISPPSLGPTHDIMLNSVTLSSGKTISDFVLVQSANIISNDTWTGGDTGAASSDRGDNASGIEEEAATNSSVVASLGNLNLNNIIDVEETGSFLINLSFGQAVSSLFFWERGMNSDLTIQALDQAGNLIGRLFRIDRNTWQNAGFAIDTTEISGAQQMGSRGISVGDLGLTGPIFGIQVSADASHNGPDFKVMGSVEAVPEPTTVAGLSLAGAGLAAARRRRSKQTA